MNLYSYCSNNATNRLDPLGLKWGRGLTRQATAAGLILMGPYDAARAGTVYQSMAHKWPEQEAENRISLNTIAQTNNLEERKKLSRLRSRIKNTLRHGYFSSLLCRNLPENDAEQALLIHEQYGGNLGSTDSNVDMWNNEVGRRIGLGNGNIETEVLKAYASGELSYSEWHEYSRGLRGKKCGNTIIERSNSDDSSAYDSRI